MIVSPPVPCIADVARLVAGERGVIARLPERDERFRKLIRSLGYTWDEVRHHWYRRLDECSGPIPDRLLETAASLSQAGFTLELADELGARLLAGDWQPERTRWVVKVGDRFGLRWRGKDDNLWTRSRLLPGSDWDPVAKAVTVPLLYYAEVAGFADEHDFELSADAQGLMSRAEREYRRVLLPEVPVPAPAKKRGRRRERSSDPVKFADLPIRNLSTTTELYPHQRPAVEKLLPLRLGALFMDMGTGKTRVAIELVTRRQQRLSRVIWFCPVSLKLTIAYEISKHTTGETVYVFDDDTRSGSIPDALWYIVGIESMSSSDRVVLAVKDLIDADTFVVVDESSYIKGHASLRTLRITELAKPARYRLLLTGTPISQGVEDLYAQMRFLSPEIIGYGSFYSFARNHLEYSDRYPDMIVRAHDVGHLTNKIAPYVHQVTKEECLSLPEKLYNRVYCPLTDEQIEAYWQAKDEILLGADDPSSYVIFQLFTALQQIVSGYWNRKGETVEYPHKRLEMLKVALDSIPEGEKVIIWCKFIRSVQQIAQMLPGAALYYGELSERRRADELTRFRGDGCRYLIATQATGGHGLTLNEAHHVIFYENEFKYSHRIQAEDRCHRIGQTLPVTYTDIVALAGIDERIQSSLAKKEDVVKAFRAQVKKVKDKAALLGEL